MPPFNWQTNIDRCEKNKIKREILLAKSHNPDWKLQHPDEHRDITGTTPNLTKTTKRVKEQFQKAVQDFQLRREKTA